MTFVESAGICCRNQKLIATIPPETRSVPTFFIITLSRIFVITLSRIFVKLLHDLHHKRSHHSKTAHCSPKDLDPLSLRGFFEEKQGTEREKGKVAAPHLPQLGQILFFNSSELRPRIMKGQVKDNLRNKLISSS